MTQQEYIETLIISDMSGNITDEEKSHLIKILAESEDARNLSEKMHKILASKEARMVINAPPGEEPFKHQPPKVRYFDYYPYAGLSVAAIAIIIMGYFILQQGANTHNNIVSFNKDSLQLMLGNKEMVNLDGYDTIDVSGSVKASSAYTYLLDTVKHEEQWATLNVPAGKFHHILLPGGIKILSYAATTIRFPVSFNNNREFYVDGKAFIDVPPDAGKPFSIHLSHCTAQVLGTQLSVSSYDKKDEVSLVRGRVKVSTDKDIKELKPGEKTSIQPDHKLKISLSTDDLILSGIFENEDITLKEIADFIERNYRVKVKLDPQDENRRFSVIINCHKPVEEFLKSLNDVTHLENAIVITK